MNIDFIKTQERCKLLNYAALAREIGLTRQAVQMICAGKYKRMQSPNAKAVLGKLRDMGLLVECESDHDSRLAA
jgi:hypothetical protein